MSSRDVDGGAGATFFTTILECVAAMRSLLIEEIAMRGPAPLEPRRPISGAARR